MLMGSKKDVGDRRAAVLFDYIPYYTATAIQLEVSCQVIKPVAMKRTNYKISLVFYYVGYTFKVKI